MPSGSIASKAHILKTPRKVTMKDLFAHGKMEEKKGIDFWSGLRKANIPESQASIRGRYPWHYDFLERYKHNIKTFADVGCALPLGAPTTIQAKEHLPDSLVIAVDVAGDFNHPDLKKHDILPLDHHIGKAPLPNTVDAIRFASVSQWMPQSQRRRALLNIHKSLNTGGLLMSDEYVYRKTPRGFEIIAEVDQKAK